MCLKSSVVTHNVQEDFSFKYSWKWMVNSLVVRANPEACTRAKLEYGGREASNHEVEALHLKPETKLKKEKKKLLDLWISVSALFRLQLGIMR